MIDISRKLVGISILFAWKKVVIAQDDPSLEAWELEKLQSLEKLLKFSIQCYTKAKVLAISASYNALTVGETDWAWTVVDSNDPKIY